MGSSSSVPSLPNSTLQVAHNIGAAAVHWDVQTGGSADDFALQDLDFYPNKITIDAGDTITFHVAGGPGGDAHTVAFVPSGQSVPSPDSPKDLVPAGGTTVDGTKFVNSGILFGGSSFTLTFSNPGTYRILCLFHEPAMESTVIVHSAGTPYPHDALYYREIGDSQKEQDLADARSSVALFPFKPGGTTLAAGIDPFLVQYPPSDSTVLRFLDSGDVAWFGTSGNLTVEVGTVVTWVNETSNEPHTLTFPLAGQRVLPNIPPDPAVNVSPSGVTKFDGSKIVNSGTIHGGTRFRLMFTKPGTYFYGCIYHDNSGMHGLITVKP